MKVTINALAAGVLLAFGAGAANAAIVGGNTTGTTGEIFLNVTDGENTFAYDTGLTVNAFLGLTAAQVDALQWDFSADPNWAPFKGNTNLRWNLVGANTGVGISTGTLNRWGFVTTVQGGKDAVLGANFAVSNYNGLATKLASQANNINQFAQSSNVADNISANIPAGTPASYDKYGSNFQLSWGLSNEFVVGEYAPFAWLGRNQVANGFGATAVKKVGIDFQTVTLSTDGVLQFQAVPVPGAVWLMGSALAGLVGFARRRNA